MLTAEDFHLPWPEPHRLAGSQLQRLVPFARQFDFDDLAAVQQLDANHRTDRMDVLDGGLQALVDRMMRDVDIVRANEGSGLFRHLVALDLGIATLLPAVEDVHIAEELIDKG